MIFLFIFLSCLTLFFGYISYNQKREANLIVATGVTLALITTIFTILSAIVTIVVGLFVLFEDHLWWWF